MTDPSNVAPGKDNRSKNAEYRLKDQGLLDKHGNLTETESFLDDEETPKLLEDTENIEAEYNRGLEYFEELGYRLRPSPRGIAANHNVYKLREPQNLKGLKLPDNYRKWEQIFVGPAFSAFQMQVQAYIAEDPKPRQFWNTLLKPETNKASTLYALATNRLQAISQEQLQSVGRPLELGIEPTARIPEVGQNIADIAPRAFLPPREWFAPSLHQVTLDDILTIFPPAERRLFALILGRALVGRNNSITPSGKLIKHTSRMAAILCGPAGLGKSTLFESLWAAASWAGYYKKTVKDIGARFNIGAVATADIIYKDDTSQKELRKVFESSTAKTIITSNDVLSVEDKGQDAYEILPVGTLFMNANTFNPRDTFSMDPGMADRIKLLATINGGEFQKLATPNKPEYLELGPLALESPNANAEHHLDWLCEKLNVSKIALMLWCLRLCADNFLEVIEIREDEEGNPINMLAKVVKELSLKLQISLFTDVTEQVLSAAIFASHRDPDVTLKVTDPTRDSSWLSYSIGSSLISNYVKFRTQPESQPVIDFLRWHLANFMPGWAYHPFFGFRNTHSLFVKKAHFECEDIARVHTDVAQFEAVLHFFKSVRASNGVEVSADPVWLLKAASVCPSIDAKLKEMSLLYGYLAMHFSDFEKQTFDPAPRDELEANFVESCKLLLENPQFLKKLSEETVEKLHQITGQKDDN